MDFNLIDKLNDEELNNLYNKFIENDYETKISEDTRYIYACRCVYNGTTEVCHIYFNYVYNFTYCALTGVSGNATPDNCYSACKAAQADYGCYNYTFAGDCPEYCKYNKC